MPLFRGQVTLGAQQFEVEPFAWPSSELRTVTHKVQGGTIVEIDPTPLTSGRPFNLRGTQRSGWYYMSDAVKAAIIAIYVAGNPVTLTDWRGNTASVMFIERPTFEDSEADGYYTFEFPLIAVT